VSLKKAVEHVVMQTLVPYPQGILVKESQKKYELSYWYVF
jgi:hypothetical protein